MKKMLSAKNRHTNLPSSLYRADTIAPLYALELQKSHTPTCALGAGSWVLLLGSPRTRALEANCG